MRLEHKLEAYNDIVETGCFYCSEVKTSIELDYEHDHCIDICAGNGITGESVIQVAEWDKVTGISAFIAGTKDQGQIDSMCTQIILSSMGELVTDTQYLTSGELTAFAESLIFDDRAQICLAYDPRDVHQRRLQTLEEADCNRMNCFDCSYTAGFCAWEP